MTLLSISQSVLRIVGWDNLSTISGNTDKTARQVMALANQEVENLAKRFDWRHLQVEYEFSTVASQAAYVMPAAFDKLMQDSVYNKDEYYRLRSSMSDVQWNQWKHGLLGSISHQRFRTSISPTGLHTLTISPTPTSAEDMVLWYKSKYPVVEADGTTTKLRYENDSDMSIVPEDVVQQGLLWRFKSAKGLDFSAELAEYNEMTRTRFAQTRGEGDLPIPNGNFTPELTDGYVPDSGFGA